jgi:hypothetical protein
MKRYICKLNIDAEARGLRIFYYMENHSFYRILTRGRRKGWDSGKSILPQISWLFLIIGHLYSTQLSPIRQQAHAYFLPQKIMISPKFRKEKMMSLCIMMLNLTQILPSSK